jgi:AraC family transcriptional regulator of adaptative response / DNA-3-methyladenine glycosylase II
LPMAETAFAAGFASVRSFNDVVRDVFATSPTDLRRRAAHGGHGAAPGTLDLRLPFRQPLCPDNLFGHLAATAVPGIEEWRDGWYRRTLRLPHGAGVVALAPRADHIACRLNLGDLRDLAVAISRCRAMLDLDADPAAIDEQLGADPYLAAPVAKDPGRRVPRTVDPEELAVRTVLGQQISIAAARTHAARLVLAHGEKIDDPHGGLTRLFPDPATLAALDPATLALPRARRTTLTALVAALASGTVDLSPAVAWDDARRALSALPGLGPWTVEIIAMRALGDPDAFPLGDLGVVRAAANLGLPSTPRALAAVSEAWRPWRAYAVQHLWATGDHAVNRLPA